MSGHAAAVEDDADSVYKPEEGELVLAKPRIVHMSCEREHCANADNVDELLDCQDAELRDDPDQPAPARNAKRAVRKLISDKEIKSNLDDLEEVHVVSDDDVFGGVVTDVALPLPETTSRADVSTELDDDDSGFASDENVIDDEDVDDLDSSQGEIVIKYDLEAADVEGVNERANTKGNQAEKPSQRPTTRRNGTGATQRPAAQSPLPLTTSRSVSDIGNSVYHTPDPKSNVGPIMPVGRENKTPPSSNFFNSLARAGATFYRTAFKPGRPASQASDVTSKDEKNVKHSPTKQANAEAGMKATSPALEYTAPAARKAHAAQVLHSQVISIIEAQIATLNGAKAGFVDLALLKPMTERTRKVIEDQAFGLLDSFGKLDMRVKDLEEEIAATDKRSEAEMSEKEQVLIAAKLNIAETQGDVLNLKNDLAGVRKQLNDPSRLKAKSTAELRARAAAAKAKAMMAMEARNAAEGKLEIRRRQLEAERATTKRLEASCKDMEGDWA